MHEDRVSVSLMDYIRVVNAVTLSSSLDEVARRFDLRLAVVEAMGRAWLHGSAPFSRAEVWPREGRPISDHELEFILLQHVFKLGDLSEIAICTGRNPMSIKHALLRHSSSQLNEFQHRCSACYARQGAGVCEDPYRRARKQDPTLGESYSRERRFLEVRFQGKASELQSKLDEIQMAMSVAQPINAASMRETINTWLGHHSDPYIMHRQEEAMQRSFNQLMQASSFAVQQSNMSMIIGIDSIDDSLGTLTATIKKARGKTTMKTASYSTAKLLDRALEQRDLNKAALEARRTISDSIKKACQAAVDAQAATGFTDFNVTFKAPAIEDNQASFEAVIRDLKLIGTETVSGSEANVEWLLRDFTAANGGAPTSYVFAQNPQAK